MSVASSSGKLEFEEPAGRREGGEGGGDTGRRQAVCNERTLGETGRGFWGDGGRFNPTLSWSTLAWSRGLEGISDFCGQGFFLGGARDGNKTLSPSGTNREGEAPPVFKLKVVWQQEEVVIAMAANSCYISWEEGEGLGNYFKGLKGFLTFWRIDWNIRTEIKGGNPCQL